MHKIDGTNNENVKRFVVAGLGEEIISSRQKQQNIICYHALDGYG